jgi:uncharacterized protein
VHSKFTPCLYTALTTMVAFGSLLVSGIRPVIDFGWMMVIGLGSRSCCRSRCSRPRCCCSSQAPGQAAQHHRRDHGRPGKGNHGPAGHHALAVAAVLGGRASPGLSSSPSRTASSTTSRSRTEIYQGMRLIDEQLGGTTPLDVLIDAPPRSPRTRTTITSTSSSSLTTWRDAGIASTSYWLNSTRLPEVRRVHEYLESLPGTGKVLSIATAMDMFGALEPRVLSEDFFLSVFYRRLPEAVKEALFDPYLSEDGNQVRFSIRIYESAPDLRRNEMLQEIHRHIAEDMGYGASRCTSPA